MDFTELVVLDGGEENKDYFTAQTLDKGENLQCELGFVKDKNLFALDLKAHILLEKIKWQGDDGDNSKLTSEVAKHLEYISQTQYVDSLTGSVPQDLNYETASTIIALKNYEQVDILKRVAKDFDFSKFNIELKIFNEVNDLFL